MTIAMKKDVFRKKAPLGQKPPDKKPTIVKES
jgi:hypothetical protein